MVNIVKKRMMILHPGLAANILLLEFGRSFYHAGVPD